MFSEGDRVWFAGLTGTVEQTQGAYAFVAWDERPASWHSIFDLTEA